MTTQWHFTASWPSSSFQLLDIQPSYVVTFAYKFSDDLVIMNEIENNYIYRFFELVSCHHGMTFYKLSVLCAGGTSAHFSLHVLDSMYVFWNAWIIAVTGQSKAPTHLQTAVMNIMIRLASKECQTHSTLLTYEANLLERKPKTLRIERSRTCLSLGRAGVETSCVVNK